jgi:bifunctional non-homologous end joining protein LigD
MFPNSMGLSLYKKKRNFAKTSEPAGKVKTRSKELIFTVQKHAASHLHYDFRLEMEGVLKSWAVPKGPSLNPEDKRLAMMVEDHPYDYKDFEGNIPEGNYGAGNVIVWDYGTYEPREETDNPEKSLLAGLKKGHITFILHGKKLKGEFVLVKLRNGKQENAWLLVKKDDKYASTEDVLKKDKSVLSRATLETLAKRYGNDKTGKPRAANEKPKATAPKKRAVKKKPATQVKPMLAELHDKAFDSDEWVYEMKYDGYRALALCDGEGGVELYSRNLLSFNNKYKAVVEELKKIKHPCLIDGEVVVEDRAGQSSFQALQNFNTTGKGTLKYFVFDILSLDDNDLTGLPLLQRKELLELLLKKHTLKNIFYSPHVKEKGTTLLAKAQKKGGEGIIAKKAESPYRTNKRSSEWLKIKISNEQEAVIVGFTEPRGSRNHFGSLLLGVYDGKELIPAGHCGTGFDFATLNDLYNKFKPLFTDKSPFKKRVRMNGKVQWLKPKLVAQVKFTEWTGEGSMRHPVFLGLREDKKASEVKREIAKA